MASSTKTASGQINRELLREYRTALGKLTFNCKPIINDLSRKAESHIDDAETIIKAIEDHLRFSEPSIKLPAFYLLDSIFKNVGGMYISLMHGRLGNIFINMWKSVDSKVKGNMERTLASWRNGFEGGHRNLFPEFVLRKIEEDLNRQKAKAKEYVSTPPPPKSDNLLDDLTNIQSYSKKRALEERQQSIQREVTARADRHSSSSGGRSGSHYTPGRRHSHQQPQEPSHKKLRTNGDAMAGKDSTLLQEVERVIKKKKIDLFRRPNDSVLFNALETLKVIKQVASDPNLHPSRVEEIRQQLAGIELGTLPHNNGVKKSTTPPLSPGIAAAAGHRMHSSGYSANGASEINKQTPPVDPNHILNNIMSRPDLISSLSKIVPSLSNSLGSLLVQPNQQESQVYTHLSQLEPVALTQTSITKVRPGIFNILYRGYPNQCLQCGLRTTDDEKGRETMKKHLDWHFRRNVRSQNERGHRGTPRGWYTSQAMWEAAAADEDVVMNDGQNAGSGKDESNIEELRKMTVMVPAGHTEPCGICREPFERRFNEDEEDWEYVNAVNVDGTIFHATCQAKRASPVVLLPSPAGSS